MEALRGGYPEVIVGDTLPKRYTSPKLIARGGMGEVYRATDSVLDRTVAVKLLSERHAREPEARARFRREALAAARMSGARHVVTLFDVAEHDGRPLIVMEYVDGGSVHDRMQRGPVTREQALTWLEQTATALDRAHAEGVVHRDVKPANVLLDRDGNAHVSDFGIASTTGVDTVTLPGTVLGTVGYLAPEQARGEPASPASDRYSLAVVAFELLAGRRPFESETATAEVFAHLHAPVPRATSFAPELPAAVDAVFSRALAKKPGDRPATCVELVRELRRALAADTRAKIGALPHATLDPVAPTRRLPAAAGSVDTPAHRADVVWRRAPLLLLLALLLAAGTLTLLLGATDRGPDEAGGTGASTSGRTTTSGGSPSTSHVDGAALNEAGYARLQAGDFQGALPLLRRAVLALRWTNTLPEAYASYNLAYARFALGRCDGVIGLLDRSQRIQGVRTEIDELRARWDERCGSASSGDVDEGGRQDKGRGKGKDRDKGRD